MSNNIESQPQLTEDPSSSESSHDHDHDSKGPIDVCGDGGVMKEILKEGDGWETPKKGTEVDVHYVGTLLDGTEFDSSRKRGETFNFKVGSGVIKGWSEVIKTMKKGEIAKVTLKPEYAYGENGSPPSIPENATLVFEIELLKFTTEKDLSKDKDGGIMKKVVSEGDGSANPSFESKVVVSYVGKVDGAVVDEVKNKELALGEGDLSEGLEKTVESMKVNEKCEVKISSKYSPMTKNFIVYEVELHSLKKAIDPWECKNYDDVVAASLERKESGNVFFKNNHLNLAIKKYEKGLKFLEQTSKLQTDEEKKKVKDFASVLHINLSLCYFNQKNYKKSLEQANKALEINANNTKALYRKGLALVEQGDWDLGGEEYTKALKIEPDNKSVKLAEAKLQRILHKQEQKDKKLYGKLFSTLSKELDEEEKKNKEEEKKNEVKEEKTEEMTEEIKESLKEQTQEENLTV